MKIIMCIWNAIKIVVAIPVLIAIGWFVLMMMCGITHGACSEGHEMKSFCKLIGACDSKGDSDERKD